MKKGLIIEGVAGTGKSSILSRLHCEIISEEKTTGNLVQELRYPKTDEQRCNKLYRLLPQIKVMNGPLILERFHPTYYALMPNWDLIDEADRTLARLGYGLVLLDFPDELLRLRTFKREEMSGWEEDLVEWYGSEEKALKAFQESQQNRRNFLKQTRLPYLVIDTSEKDWDTYVQKIMKFAEWGSGLNS